jgi:hypothetical protein
MAEKDKVSSSLSGRAVSQNAFSRLLALRGVETNAARRMVSGDTYSDFFVEGSGPPFHEAFEDVITGAKFRDNFTVSRMAAIDRIRLAMDDDGYSDFFVEGGGDPWHEAFEDVITGDKFSDLTQRIRALGKLTVLQAYAQIRVGLSK